MNKFMNAMSNKWKPDVLSSGNAGDDALYSPAQSDAEQDELTNHIADKKTRQIGRMIEFMVILFVAAISAFAVYKLFTSL